MSLPVFTEPRTPLRPARIALAGPSGAGLTRTALELATAAAGAAGTVAVIDSDRAKAAQYAGTYQFLHHPMSKYEPEDLTRAVLTATDLHLNALVIDTWSPFWAGVGGILDRVDRAGWKVARPAERLMISALLNFPGTLVVTVRADAEHVAVPTEGGRYVVRRVPGKWQQRTGLETDFHLVLDLDDTYATVGKSNCPALAAGTPLGTVGEATAAQTVHLLDQWLTDTANCEPRNIRQVYEWAFQGDVTAAQLRAEHAELEALGQVDAVVPSPVAGSEFLTIGEVLFNLWTRLERPAREALRPRVAAAS